MKKYCTNPVFIGTAVWTTIGFKTYKLSRLKEARELPNGNIELITLNNTYHAGFTCEETRAAFIKTCETIGKLK